MYIKKEFIGKKVIIFILLLFTVCLVYSQEKSVDYNIHYSYPLSFGIKYMSLFPVTEFRPDYNFTVIDISGNVSTSFNLIPRLKPNLHAGITFVLGKDTDTSSDPDNSLWDHTTLYAGVGTEYSHLFSKNFGSGLDILAALSYSSFPNLFEEPRGNFSVFFDIRADLIINPTYNLSINVNPGLRYQYALTPLHDFDGLLFSLGGSLSFRLGEDPDITQILRSIRFNQVAVNSLFAAMQSYYSKNPIGIVTITNTEKHNITDVKTSFYQAGFMDSPTPSTPIVEIGPGETVDINLFAIFNSEVFEIEGITPLTGEIIISYNSNGKPGFQKQTVVYDLHDKTALTWDDNRKVAAYITPQDSIIKDYASFIKQSVKNKTLSIFNKPIQTAIQVYNALDEIGCLYQIDPIIPFHTAQGNEEVVDSINLPRDTLARITGDCDDLSVLFLSLMETMGIETGFITIPGHIYPVFNTGMPIRHYKKIHPDRNMIINIKGQIWLPVEITMIGRGSFLEAWNAGMKEWQVWEGELEKRNLYFSREAQKIYRAVGLRKKDKDFAFGNAGSIALKFEKNMNQLANIIIEDHSITVGNTKDKTDYNKLGIIYASFKKYEKAEKAFNSALKIDPEYNLAKINLGNLYFQTNKYKNALSQYYNAQLSLEKEDISSSKVYTKLLLKISVVNYQLEQFKEAERYYAYARKKSSDEIEEYAYLMQSDAGNLRSAEEKSYSIILQYFEEE